ncbi:hypothetical protein [Ancylothrix sp. D3o]|uniref:hypothetical protein n=1 Tax=Ancylothrix sp. D3o TaxID=2953691 RepID=UPI0021BB4C1F|nr:hypothetical protein [Ancylothrix sp. D3o]
MEQQEKSWLFRCKVCRRLIITTTSEPKTPHRCMINEKVVQSFGQPELLTSGPANPIGDLAITLNQEGPNPERKGI